MTTGRGHLTDGSIGISLWVEVDPVNRFVTSRHFLYMGFVAVALGAMSSWVAWKWLPAALPASLFVVTAALLFWLSARPVIEVTDRALTIGKRTFPWSSITRIQSTGWLTPLILRLTTDSKKSLLLVYPGDLESSGRLREIIMSCAPHALVDGQPQRKRQAVLSMKNTKSDKLENYELLSAEDEAEVERMFQRLREVGDLDSQRSSEEK
jgi:hypothetical protein